MQLEDLEPIAEIPLFANLARDTLQELAKGAFLQRFPSETVLYRQGELPDFFHVLLEGSVQLTGTAPDERETVVEIVNAVDGFMAAAALTNSPYLVSAKVVHPARILLVPAAALRARIAQDPQLSLAMLASLSRQNRSLIRQIKDLKLRTSTQRLGCYLLTLARESGDGDRVELPHDKRLLAARLGMTPESLSRAFSSLRETGVEVRGHSIQLHDMQKLRTYCIPDQLIDGPEQELKVVAA